MTGPLGHWDWIAFLTHRVEDKDGDISLTIAEVKPNP